MQTRMDIESIGKNKRGWPKKKSQKISEEQESSRLPRRSHQRSRDLVAVPRRAAYVRKRIVGDSG